LPSTVKPSAGSPSAVNPTLLSTNKLSTNKLSTNSNSPKSKKQTYGPDDLNYKLANLLLNKIKENNPNAKTPNIQKWANSIRLMHERDSRSYDDIEKMITWSQSNEFWSGVILSTTKLRSKYDQMFVQANKRKRSNKSKRNHDYELPY